MDCEKFFPEERNAIIGNLTEDEKQKIAKLSHWVVILFLSNLKKIVGATIFCSTLWPSYWWQAIERSSSISFHNLMVQIVRDLSVEDRRVSVYTAHDYSILAVMSALGKGKDCLDYNWFRKITIPETCSVLNLFCYGNYTKTRPQRRSISKFAWMHIHLKMMIICSNPSLRLVDFLSSWQLQVDFRPRNLGVSFAVNEYQPTLSELQEWVSRFHLYTSS